MSAPKFLRQSHRLDSIVPSGIRKMFARAQGLEGVISLGIGAPDIPPPERLLELMAKLAGLKTSSYVLNSGIPQLRDKLVDQYRDLYSLEFEREGIVVTAGGTQLMFTAIMSMTDPGDEIIIPDPGFVYYPTIPQIMGTKPVHIPLDDNFQMDPELINEQITDKTKMIILNTPSNPTGAILEKQKLKAIAEIAIENELTILSDEVYEFMVFKGKEHVPIARFAPENTVTLNSFSKTYCIPGWRLGYGIGEKKLMEPIAKLHPFIMANSPSLPQWALAEFIGTPEDIKFRKLVKETMERRAEVTIEEFNKIDGIEVPPINGSFYAFPKVKNLSGENPGEMWTEKVFNEAKVVTVPGSEFGHTRNDHFRISFGSANEEKIREAATRIRELNF